MTAHPFPLISDIGNPLKNDRVTAVVKDPESALLAKVNVGPTPGMTKHQQNPFAA
jgi:hypothetical protein